MGFFRSEARQLKPRSASGRLEQIDSLRAAQHDQAHILRHRFKHEVADKGSVSDVASDQSRIVRGIHDDRQ